ncbi:hypothetical protein CEXT_76321 [Caerostris extrusa]|uniref:C2H2-type domain-containing protein n=1 Tax=Caerostris extrusa TaxID=172846 RepID=A0AAV4NE97_CAEEX|nr:hypothetical protein CEXT_76321 [Caerostris extrusa]
MRLSKNEESLHKCSKRPMIFRRKDYLESHEAFHNVEKPYVCSFCDKAFTRSDKLGDHIRLPDKTCPQHPPGETPDPSLPKCLMLKHAGEGEAFAILAANSLLRNSLELTSVRKNKYSGYS